MEYKINSTGEVYHEAVLEDTKKTIGYGALITIAGMFFFFVMANYSIFYGILLSLIPFSGALIFVYLLPVRVRGRNINKLVKKIKISGNTVVLDTFDFYTYSSKELKFDFTNIQVKLKPKTESSGEMCIVKYRKASSNDEVYIIKEFYDAWNNLLSELNPLAGSR